jgi:hemolysin activation/secretion protein
MSTLNKARTATFGLAALLGATCAVTATTAAHAQAVERNLPPAVGADVLKLGPNAVASKEDATPIGPALSGVVLLGPSSPLVSGPVSGVDASAVARLNTPQGQALLKPFLGQKLSKKLIAEIEAAIAGYYRGEGYPFVALQTPEQEITSGVVQFRVIEFSLGQVKVEGGERTRADYVTGRVRAAPGQPINGDDLAQDLDWLNRNPFRRADAVFTPGQRLGDSDLKLQVRESRPWRVYGGYANSGTPSTGRDRYFVGASALLGQDTVLSYQFTGGSDGLTSDPKYASHAARLFVPIAPRQAIEATLSVVESNAAVAAFDIKQKTAEFTVGYVTALSNFSNLPGDLSAGVELKHQKRDIFFGATSVLSQPIDVYQLYAGWSNSAPDRFGRYDVDVTLHVSPGDLGDGNTSAAFKTYSSGRVTQANYVYLQGAYDRVTRLGGVGGGVSLITQVIAQISSEALPESERIGLGGSSLVRGYSLDDGAYDRGVVLRNELRAAVFNHAFGPVTVAPFAFLDAGYGKDKASGAESKPVSTGLGLDVRVANSFSVSATAGYAMKSAPSTDAGDWRADVRLTATF